jgi:tRNA (guanine37-N1)-methyltransferase
MRFTVVTILPELIGPALAAGVVGRASTGGVIDVGTVNPRDFTSDRHRTVDDTPYGGGPGMVMKAPPLLAAIADACARGGAPPTRTRRILMSPSGARLTQATVRRLATCADHLVLVCGRYEGVDQRVIDLGIDEELSLGDFVLSGGELAALAVIDAVARLVPGVLGEPTSADDESFSAGLLEYPQYTRPAIVEGLEVPEVLAGGNHAVIARWRHEQALRRTAVRRPDLWPTVRQVPPAHDVAQRTYVALCHHPVRDRDGRAVTSSLTNFDVHDLARSASTYGLAGYVVVTPITSQREKAEHIARVWEERETGEHRAAALALVSTAASIADAVAAVAARHGGAVPRVVATSAAANAFAGLERFSPPALVSACAAAPAQPVLILLGTGWGLIEEQVVEASCVLTPITGRPAWNHLSVRSAAAIILDRLFGLAAEEPSAPGPTVLPTTDADPA